MNVDISARPVVSTRRRFLPTDPSGTPSVDRLLLRLGMGRLLDEGLTAHPGRNDNWAGLTERGQAVFVKRIGGTPAESLRRFHRVLAFERAATAAAHPIRAPRLLGSDEDARLLVFELVEEARTGSDLAAEDAFDEELSRRAGRTLAALHVLRPNGELPGSPPSVPSASWFDALPWPVFAAASAGTLEAWRLLQGDGALHGALRELWAGQEGAPSTPVHGDVRLDQFLFGSDDALMLTDWEEFGLGEPARDLGAFAGDLLYRAVLKVPSGLDHGSGGPAPHDQVVRAGVAELDRMAPLVAAFWSGYTTLRPEAASDPRLLERATAFAGWHLLDRLLASARMQSRLTAAERAAAGIGRTALLTPQAFVTVLGWGGPLA
ncbi:class V lanthionine synthetase subunit LxmK [Streptomyces sp. NPDC004752]